MLKSKLNLMERENNQTSKDYENYKNKLELTEKTIESYKSRVEELE